MCKITSMELYGTELDMPVVRDFELWFQTAFGVSDREAWWVLAHYVSRRSAEPDGEVIAHLLSLLDEGSAVFDWPLDQVGTITLPGMLIVPAESVVKSDVQAAGVICSGDVQFKGAVRSIGNDVRVHGRLRATLSFLRGGGCIVGSVHTLGDIRTEGDLIVAGELHCEGNLAARSFVRARTFKLKGTGAVDGGMETVEEFNVAGRMRHKGALEIQGGLRC
jgi:hypothetical protein